MTLLNASARLPLLLLAAAAPFAFAVTGASVGAAERCDPESDRQYRLMAISNYSKAARAQFEAACVHILDRREGDQYVVSAPGKLDLAQFTARLMAAPLGGTRLELLDRTLNVEDKVAPAILRADPAERFDVLIQFYRDAPASQIRRTLATADAEHHAPMTWRASLSARQILDIGGLGMVRRIERGPAPVEFRNDRARSLIGTDAVVQPCDPPCSPRTFELSGKGVRVGVADQGVHEDHKDFGGSRFYDADAGIQPTSHGTRVASIIGGSGTAQAHLYGHAPGVRLGNYRTLQTRIAAYERALIEHGTHVTNHSYGLVMPDGKDGYTLESSLLDQIIRGGILPDSNLDLPAAPQLWAAGFCFPEGHVLHAEACVTTQRPTVTDTSKNMILVAAVDSRTCGSDRRRCRRYSQGSGPTFDHRIKPDLVAPGCHDRDDEATHGIWAATFTSTNPSDDRYSGNCGESFAVPVVTGTLALVMEELSNRGTPVQHPATYKALLVHTAIDQLGPSPGSPACGYHEGPDGATGWGLVEADAAVQAAAGNESWLEGTLELQETFERCVRASDQPVKVTLAWDDPPGTPCSSSEAVCSASPVLTHDLDLRLEGPGGTIAHPWTLTPDPSNVCANDPDGAYPFKAVRNRDDDRNNLEVVETDGPVSGVWRVTVTAKNLVDDQTFGLFASHPLQVCSTLGRAPSPPELL